jgi:hypothetical protein
MGKKALQKVKDLMLRDSNLFLLAFEVNLQQGQSHLKLKKHQNHSLDPFIQQAVPETKKV